MALLDGDCLRAVLSRVARKELIKNVSLKLVSKEFREATSFALKAKADHHPFTLLIHTDDSYTGEGEVDLSIAGVYFDYHKLATLESGSMLELISGIYFDDYMGMSESELPTDFKDQLTAVLKKLAAVKRVTVVCATTTTETGASRPFYAFERLLSEDVPFLSQLTSFELQLRYSASPAFCRLMRDDFLRVTQSANQLTDLTIPLGLFIHTATATGEVWARLSKLNLKSVGCRCEPFRSCQDVLQLICNVCPALSDLSYDCNTSKTFHSPFENSCSGGAKGCIYDFTHLLQLEKLRSLWFEFGASEAHERRCLIPVLEHVNCLRITGQPKFSFNQLFQLIDIAPNVKRLHVSEAWDSSSKYDTFHQLSKRLSYGRLAKLKYLTVDGRHFFLHSLRLVTTIGRPVALRHVRLSEGMPSSFDGFRFECREAFVVVQDAIANACNVSHLRLPLRWRDSYLQLEQALVAMATGSIIWLVLDVDWHHRHSYELDQRLVKAVLPDGCEISEWNVFEQKGFPDSIVIRGKKRGYPVDVDISPPLNSTVDKPGYFWVRLQTTNFQSDYD